MSLPELKLSESEVASYINSRLVADYPQKVAMLQAIVNGDFEEAVKHIESAIEEESLDDVELAGFFLDAEGLLLESLVPIAEFLSDEYSRGVLYEFASGGLEGYEETDPEYLVYKKVLETLDPEIEQ
ncbi:MAG: hypothetical protein KC582_00780 [Candidatus Magasanikbacteria bacterium]|nr:hypothetical protein [Candidatus Magasanikbacteria bacterium]